MIQKKYQYNPHDYDDLGIDASSGKYFLDVIKEMEYGFHEQFYPYKANFLFAGHSTMSLLDKCLDNPSNLRCGMDLIDEQIDVETNFMMEEYSRFRTIYAMESALAEDNDEGIFLVLCNSVPEYEIILKYIADDDSDEFEEPRPVNVLSYINK